MVETSKEIIYDTVPLIRNLLAEITRLFPSDPLTKTLDSGPLNPKNLGVNIKTLVTGTGRYVRPDPAAEGAARAR